MLAIFARPLLVGIVRAGYAVKDEATEIMHEAKTAAESIRDEARAKAHHTPAAEAEIRRLREEVAALKSKKS